MEINTRLKKENNCYYALQKLLSIEAKLKKFKSLDIYDINTPKYTI